MRSDRPRHLRIVLLLGATLGALALLVVSPASGFPTSTTVNCAPYGNDDLQAALDGYTVVNVRGTCFGNFTVNRSETVQGVTPGAGINGRGTATDLTIAYGMYGSVTIQNMTFTGGYAKYGGGIYLYGPITLNLTNSVVRWNRAFVGGAGIYAGGGAVLNLTGTTVTHNSAAAYGGGVYVLGADLFANASTFSLNDTMLNGSSVPGNGGGGIFVEGGDASLANSKVTANKALGYGGGIGLVGQSHQLCATVVGGACIASQGKDLAAQDEPLVSELTLTGSSVDHNVAENGDGGGIYSDAGNIDFASPADTSVTLDGSIVSFNSAVAGDGGGVANYGECGRTATLLATGTAFQGNQARNGEGGALYNATGEVCVNPGTALVTIGKSPVSNGKSVTNSNQAKYGGGIANEQDEGVASITLQPGASVQGNKASVTGGGVYNECGSFSSLGQIMLNSPNNVVSICT